jgi:hypothetical protein
LFWPNSEFSRPIREFAGFAERNRYARWHLINIVLVRRLDGLPRVEAYLKEDYYVTKILFCP